MRRRLVLLGAAAALALALAITLLVVVTTSHHRRTTAHGLPVESAGIRATDGVTLRAEVISPSGPGRFPLLVMPASWGSDADQYRTVAASFAHAGYVVVSYAQRGFGGSGGEIDFAGPATQQDLSTVVSWALAHTAADSRHIGAVGISYGAGISLLGAERDARIRAVVAMSGWADLATALAPDGALNVQAFYALLRTHGAAKHAGPDLKAIASALLVKNNAAATQVLQAMSPARSAATGVAALNRNGTAVMLANAYEDSIFSPASLLAFFDRLSTPKRLQLEAGDHGGPEKAGLTGGQAKVWTDARAWLDRYLKGRGSATTAQPPVQLRDVRTGAWHGYANWAATGRPTTFALSDPASTATIATTRATAWQARFTGGTDTSADAGLAQFATGEPYQPPDLRVADVSPGAAVRWTSARAPKAALVVGSPTLRLRVTSSAPRTSLFTYLYDVDGSGAGTLMSEQPYLVTGTPGIARTITVAMPPITWTVAAGHQLAVVVDTVDPRYDSPTPSGTAVTVSSAAGDPALLTVPIGQ